MSELGYLGFEEKGEYNRRLARTVGLISAVYLHELTSIYKKAQHKNKIVGENFFVIDRNYIETMTGIDEPTQFDCDQILTKAGITEVSPDNKDTIRINLGTLTKLITSASDEDLNDLKKDLKIVKKTKAVLSRSGQAAQFKKMLSTLCPELVHDAELLLAYKKWIDGIYTGTHFLTSDKIKIFNSRLNTYADRNMKLALLEVGARFGWPEFTWVVSQYEKEKKDLAALRTSTKLAEDRKALNQSTKISKKFTF